MSTRRATIAAGVVVAALIAVLAWKTRNSGDAHEAAPATTTTTATPATAPVARSATVTAPAPALAAAGSADPNNEANRPQAVPLPPGETPPPLDGKRSDPAPPQQAFTPAEVIAKRQADLKLLDDTKARLEQDLAAARTAHDATTAHDLEIRIARLTALRKKRGSELEQLQGSTP